MCSNGKYCDKKLYQVLVFFFASNITQKENSIGMKIKVNRLLKKKLKIDQIDNLLLKKYNC